MNWNIPNALTMLRIMLVPVFVIVLSTRVVHGEYIAAGIFIIASFTDSLDGYLARKWKQVTKLGIILDPLADKLLVTAALISLVELQSLAGWIAIVIIGREFAVSGLRALKAEEGVIIPASKLGKIKTITQILAIILLLVQDAYQHLLPFHLGEWAMYLAVLITIVSGIEYFYRFRY